MIHGAKPYKTEDGRDCLISCTTDDPDCTKWEVSGPGSPAWDKFECSNLYYAQKLERMFEDAVRAGRARRTAELRSFIAGADI